MALLPLLKKLTQHVFHSVPRGLEAELVGTLHRCERDVGRLGDDIASRGWLGGHLDSVPAGGL